MRVAPAAGAGGPSGSGGNEPPGQERAMGGLMALLDALRGIASEPLPPRIAGDAERGVAGDGPDAQPLPDSPVASNSGHGDADGGELLGGTPASKVCDCAIAARLPARSNSRGHVASQGGGEAVRADGFSPL